MNKIVVIGFLCVLAMFSCKKEEPKPPVVKTRVLRIISVQINDQTWADNSVIYNVSVVGKPVIKITFNDTIDVSKFVASKASFSGDIGQNFTVSKGTDTKTLLIMLTVLPRDLTAYTFNLDSGENLGGSIYASFSSVFVTQLDTTPKFPTISTDSLLTLVQKQTFRYFWDYAHPVSGLARERLGSGETVTTGGSGFGLMAILVGINRGFITRNQGFEQINKIVNFLNKPETDKFHGAFPHWMNGTTGKVIPFSTKDNGADLIETSFLMQGLLAVQAFFKSGNSSEQAMCAIIQQLWEKVEWSWFQKNGEQKLYWHWSPNYQWDMNMPITGWNEGLITYVLAASSPTFPITKSVYDNGWASNGAMKNGNSFYGVTLPLGEELGGPLFFAHYSFLGLDPRYLSDTYASYFAQNQAHARINYNYCVANPKGYTGYSENCWGLTASDFPDGYTASSPNNDQGTIAPTAALASFPYTPAESTKALNFFYYTLGNRMWGEYGFKDAFSLTRRWFADSYLAIDQGPIIVMIENYRSGLIWNTFMNHPDVKSGLTKLGFIYQ